MGALSQPQHQRHPINAPEDVGALRRAVAELASRSGSRTGEVELVATELGTNLLKHAEPGGYVLYRQAGDGIEFLSVDTGPGMHPRSEYGARTWAMRSAPAGLGEGLASIRRLADEFDCYSNAQGTVLLARLGSGGQSSGARWRYGGINIPLGDTGASGDAWAVTADQRIAALVVDGLGHGEEAAVSARAAVAVFDLKPVTDPADFLRRAHDAMRGTRGAVAAACVINPAAGQLSFAGVGNIAGVVASGADKQALVSNPGTLGTQLLVPNIRVRQYRWPPGATLFMSSDGIRTGFNQSTYPGLLGHDPAVVAAAMHRDFTRSTDDATILVVRDVS